MKSVMPVECRLLIDPPSDAAWNMACDEAMMQGLVEGKCPPTLRFYQWHPAAISLGYFQRIEKELDLDLCRRKGIQVVRRLTGGRAVLHAAEVTYSIVIRETDPGISDSVTQAYLFFSRAIVAGFSSLGITAELSPVMRTNRMAVNAQSAACFDAPSSYEILVQSKKAVGSAQVRKNGVLLQHGSIVLEFQPDAVAELMRTDDLGQAELLASELSKRAAGLNQLAGRTFEFAEVAAAMQQGFAEQCGLVLVPAQRSEWELALIEGLAKNKYGADQWNYRL